MGDAGVQRVDGSCLSGESRYLLGTYTRLIETRSIALSSYIYSLDCEWSSSLDMCIANPVIVTTTWQYLYYAYVPVPPRMILPQS
jgi:hypothetical protein